METKPVVSLATLHLLTPQQVFDHVAEHLIKQNAKSMNRSETNCLYRSDDGLSCAAGCLMTEDEYLSIHFLEGMGWTALVDSYKCVPSKHKDLICELQVIHDDNSVSFWPLALWNLAFARGLKVPQIVIEALENQK